MEQIFKLKPNLTEATKRTYSQTFKRVVKYFDKPIENIKTHTGIKTCIFLLNAKIR